MKNTIVSKIEIREVIRDSKDIRTWRNAMIYAESITNPNRQPLYDLYHDILLDAHLASLINKRINAVVNQPIKLINKKGEVEHITRMVQSEGFLSNITDLLNTKFWGHTLVEFTFDPDNHSIAGHLVDRRHVKPEKKIVCRYPADMEGISYDKPPYKHYTLEAGRPDDLGLLLKAAPLVLYKRGVLADWSQFAEIFGMPFRKGTYNGFDDNARHKLEAAIKNSGSAAWAIIPEGTDIEFIPNNSSGSSQLYDELRKACNNELSVLILGQTLTTDQGERGARSLGEVHQTEQSMINVEDRIFILNTLNEKLLPLLHYHGYDTQDGHFVFDEVETIDTAESIDIDIKLAAQIPIDDDYFYQKYNIPKPANYNQLKEEMTLRQDINRIVQTHGLPRDNGGSASQDPASAAKTPPLSPPYRGDGGASATKQPKPTNRFLRFFV